MNRAKIVMVILYLADLSYGGGLVRRAFFADNCSSFSSVQVPTLASRIRHTQPLSGELVWPLTYWLCSAHRLNNLYPEIDTGTWLSVFGVSEIARFPEKGRIRFGCAADGH